VIDCQQATGHLSSLGAAPVPRADFEREIAPLVAHSPAPVWAYDLRIWTTLGLETGPAPEAPSPAPSR